MDEFVDICPVTAKGPSGIAHWQCCLPRNHIKLQLVKKGDKAAKFLNPLSPHVLQPRLPYRNKEQ